MATRRRPLPAIARRITALEWVLVVGGWLLLALHAAGPLSEEMRRVASRSPWGSSGSVCYAVGCVAYYLLTSPRVFEADSALQMLAKHLREEPVPPSRRAKLDLPVAWTNWCSPVSRTRRKLGRGARWSCPGSLGAIAVEPCGEEQAIQWWRVHQPGPSANPSAWNAE